MGPSTVNRRLTCILAADAVGYSKQMGLDEEGTIRVLAAHRSVIDGIIAFHQGRIVSTAGDSVLAEFSSAVEAVRCAVEIQDALKTRNDSLPERRQMQFRVGVNLGDVVVKDDDLLGDGVNVAARLETIAEPGGICISSSVYDQITGKLDLGFQDIGEQSLKNIARPIRVYRVSGVGAQVRVPPTAPKPSIRRAHHPLPWTIGAIGAALTVVLLAWQAGWLRTGPTPGGGATADAPAAQPRAPAAETSAAIAATDGDVARAQGEAQRLRAEAESLKRQAEAEIARARAEVEASKAAKGKAEAEAAAARLRATTEADALRIRADAETRTARTRDASAAANTKAPNFRAGAPPPAAGSSDAPASPAATGRFDGVWNITVDCAKAADGALSYTRGFRAEVKDGVLSGEQGIEGNPGWLRLGGRIQPDGTAKLEARGVTGDPKFSARNAPRGTPFGYQVAAQFENARGSGHRLQLREWDRECSLIFLKQQ